MQKGEKRIVLTGFMGVGKSTVARHLSYLVRKRRVDLDEYIEQTDRRSIPEIIDTDGLEFFRVRETALLRTLLDENEAAIISLGGGAWTVRENRELISRRGCVSVWLESTFEHCWRNIRFSRKERPLAKDKARAKMLFEEREGVYCLSDWHFVVNPGYDSFEIAEQIADEIFSVSTANKGRP